MASIKLRLAAPAAASILGLGIISIWPTWQYSSFEGLTLAGMICLIAGVTSLVPLTVVKLYRPDNAKLVWGWLSSVGVRVILVLSGVIAVHLATGLDLALLGFWTSLFYLALLVWQGIVVVALAANRRRS